MRCDSYRCTTEDVRLTFGDWAFLCLVIAPVTFAKFTHRAILGQLAVAVRNIDCAHPLTTGTFSRKSPILTTDEINLAGVLGNRKSRVIART